MITGEQYYTTLLRLRKAIDTLIGEYAQKELATPSKRASGKKMVQEFKEGLEIQFATGKVKKPLCLRKTKVRNTV